MGKQEDFINQIAQYVQEWAREFGFGVVSAIIAQACLESAYGTSAKAKHNNYFGLKYKEGRVSCYSEIFSDTSSEQRPDGSYVWGVSKWYGFLNMETGVEGYFQFIQTGNYASAKFQTDPRAYLQALKDAGYATSKNYVDNCMNVVTKYNLTQFDEEKPMFTNSPLVNYVDITDHNYGVRTHAIDTITIHHMAGNMSVQTCGSLFHKKQGSSNYGINGKDIALYVPESNGAWTSSNKANDMRAVTIECANDLLAPYWTVSAETMNSLIMLCADICMRNGIKKLVWSNDRDERVNHLNGANMTVHRDFANTFCCGDFLYGCMPNIADAVNAILTGAVPPTAGYFINGYDYDPVFDPEYYDKVQARSDSPETLGDVFHHDKNALWNHFQNCGMNEFRQASAEFNPQVYKDRYPDLVEAFGLDNPMYYFHYVACGKAEGRIAY